MGASIPSAVSRSVAWFQQMAGVPEGHRLESNQAVDLVVKVLVKKLETKAQPIKRAPRWMTMMIGPMEEMVVWREQPKGRRIAAWMKLVKMWAALRFSDAANMQVKTPKYYDGKMTADLHKAKTTGAGKRVQELPVYVGEDAYFVQKKWLEVGLDLIKTTWREEGHDVFNDGAFSEGQTGVGPMKYYMRRLGRAATLSPPWRITRATRSSLRDMRGSGLSTLRDQPLPSWLGRLTATSSGGGCRRAVTSM